MGLSQIPPKHSKDCKSMTWECGASGRSCIGHIVSVVIVFFAFTGVGTLNAHDIPYDNNDEVCFQYGAETICVPRANLPPHSHPESTEEPEETEAREETSSGAKNNVGQARQPRQTCTELPASIRVTSPGLGAQCQRVAGAAIGHEAIMNADPIDAVDVWGWVQPGTQVCFDATGGSFRFIDTSSLPRVVKDLQAYSENGMICATIDGPGIVVLLPGPPAPTGTFGAPSPPSSQSLSGCMVRTIYALNFRDGPAGERIGGVPYNATLTALERTSGWFKVDYHGAIGWISADYAEPIGNCA